MNPSEIARQYVDGTCSVGPEGVKRVFRAYLRLREAALENITIGDITCEEEHEAWLRLKNAAEETDDQE